MFVCYLDDSGSDLQNPITTLAGYVAREREWSLFEQSVEPVFEKFGVAVLHAIEFHNTDGDFKNWSRERKERFISYVYGAMIPHIPLGLTISVVKETYEAQRKASKAQGEQRRSPYTFGFTVLYNRILDDNNSWDDDYTIRMRNAIRSEGVSFIIESGHRNNREAEISFQEIKRHYNLQRVLGTTSFADKDDSRAIQVADLLAYYSRRHVMGKMDPIFEIIRDHLPHRGFVVTDVLD